MAMIRVVTKCSISVHGVGTIPSHTRMRVVDFRGHVISRGDGGKFAKDGWSGSRAPPPVGTWPERHL